jgi:hypothetical protein
MPTGSPNLFDPTAPAPSSKINDAAVQALVPTNSQAQRAPIYGEDTVAQVNPTANPENVLDLPPVRAIFAGTPPAAYSTPEDEKNPVVQEIGARMHDVMSIGLNLYRALDGTTYALFNPEKIPGQQIKDADKAGKLTEVAVPISTLLGDSAAAGDEETPASGAQPGQEQAATPGGASLSPSPMPGRPVPAGAQNALLASRLKNLAPTSPTSRPKPGYGNLVNSLLKPAV